MGSRMSTSLIFTIGISIGAQTGRSSVKCEPRRILTPGNHFEWFLELNPWRVRYYILPAIFSYPSLQVIIQM